MKKLVSLLLCAALLASLSTALAAPTVGGFDDVPADAWYALCVADVESRGLMNGTGEGKFGPDGTLTRAMLVTILWRLAGEPDPKAAPAFTDVETGQWYTDAVAWAAENQVVLGVGNNKFAPTDPVSREQMAVIFYRWAEKEGYDTTLGQRAVSLRSASDWVEDAVKWAAQRHLLTDRFLEDAPRYLAVKYLFASEAATRAEVAVFLSRLCLEFVDSPVGREPAVLTPGSGLWVSTPDPALTGQRNVYINMDAGARGLGFGYLTRDGKLDVQDLASQCSGGTVIRNDAGQVTEIQAEDGDALYTMTYDGQGRLTCLRGSNRSSNAEYIITYTAWGDPLVVDAIPLSASRAIIVPETFSLYYENVEGRSVLTAYGWDGTVLKAYES